MCIFESATVKSDCPLQENYEIFNTDCWFALLVFLFVLEVFKSLLVIFRAFFLFRPPKIKKNSRKSTNKKILVLRFIDLES